MDTVQFIIHRKAACFDALRPYRIHINGQHVGTIRSGTTCTVELPRADAYYLEDCPFSESNAILYDQGQEQYPVLLKRADELCNAFYMEQNGDRMLLPSFHFDKLYEAIFENRGEMLSPTERLLAACVEFERGICDDLQEILASENLLSLLASLRSVGANQYAEMLEQIIRVDFADVHLPLADCQIEPLQGRIAKANKRIWKHEDAYGELHRAFVRCMLSSLSHTACIF